MPRIRSRAPAALAPSSKPTPCRSRARGALDSVLPVVVSRRPTAVAFPVGVFFGFSPLLGLHTLLAILVAFLFNLSRVAALLGVYSNLPWIIGPYYAIVTMVGAQ